MDPRSQKRDLGHPSILGRRRALWMKKLTDTDARRGEEVA
jgi:hypothetical protein